MGLLDGNASCINTSYHQKTRCSQPNLVALPFCGSQQTDVPLELAHGALSTDGLSQPPHDAKRAAFRCSFLLFGAHPVPQFPGFRPGQLAPDPGRYSFESSTRPQSQTREHVSLCSSQIIRVHALSNGQSSSDKPENNSIQPLGLRLPVIEQQRLTSTSYVSFLRLTRVCGSPLLCCVVAGAQ